MPDLAMNSPLACTIIANNYLAYARAFTRSFLARHPEGQVCVLIVDRPQPGHRYEDEPFAVVFADQLGIPSFPQVSFRYSILELNTAVKPSFLLHLHRTFGWDRVCYFDPDILVLGDLGDLYDRLGQADAVLTPHLTAPIEDRGGAERAGDPALGHLQPGLPRPRLQRAHPPLPRLVGAAALPRVPARGRARAVRGPALDGLRARLPGGRRDPARSGVQRRLLEPRPPAARGERRRLAGRPVGEAAASGVPLRFFHFSGYDFRRPDRISKFQNRFTFADRPDVAPLFQLYGERVRAGGAGDGPGLPIPVRALRQRSGRAGRRPPHPAAGRSRGRGAGPIRSRPAARTASSTGSASRPATRRRRSPSAGWR